MITKHTPLIFSAIAAFACSALSADVAPSVAFDDRSAIVSFSIPAGFKVFSESISTTVFQSGDRSAKLTPLDPPASVKIEGEAYYTADLSLKYPLPPAFTNAASVTVEWQACSDTVCLAPESRTFNAAGEAAPTIDPYSDTLAASRELYGYAASEEFLKFLDPAKSGTDKSNPLENARKRGGTLLLVLAIILGGMLLNLTPCVLPLIPVNLAILGLGARNTTRRHGMRVGACFGLGIAIAFGSLGILSAVTGAAFGTIQSSPIFNACIAIVFCVLALAMLDVFTIDFSRLGNLLRRRGVPQTGKPASPALRYLGAFAAGVGSALLSGACVAPVLIWTLVMSAAMIHEGHRAGALLPLLLGIGMGLPWPLFGGGVASLPRPGKWMNLIKYAFAAVFVAAAANYAFTAWRILMPENVTDNSGGIAWFDSLEKAEDAYASDPRPLLLYLTAEGCTACRKMSQTTFLDKKVIAAMTRFHAVKVDCTDSTDPEVKKLMARLGARGFPFFSVFERVPY